MTYQETLDFMFAQLPMYHRIGAAAYKADIQPTIDMMAALGNPEREFKSIHVAGTNGKGSVSHFLASILQEAGLKVGLYTSPHLVDFRERIRINGEMIPEQDVVDFITTHYPLLTTHALSFFEMTVGLAFDYFAREQVDIAVIEVGMGGRLDSTNVITPILSVITNIGLDHTQFLGDTLEKIAAEKGGIIKEGVPVVIGETQAETKPVFERIAAERHAPITFADKHWQVSNEQGTMSVESATYRVSQLITHRSTLISSQLTGEYQKKNIATVLETVDVLNKVLHFPLSTLHLQRGLSRVVTNTHLHGRWQKIGEHPLTICETAHNAPGVESMLHGVAATPHRGLHVVYGCVNDKDFAAILRMLQASFPSDTRWYFSQPSVPRRKPVDELVRGADAIGIHGEAYANVKDAIRAARAMADPQDLVLVTGSIFLIADALA